ELDVDDIALEPLMPVHLAEGSWGDFLAKRDELDTFYAAKYQQASDEGKALRYTGQLSISDSGKVTAKVG
ncbi:hypothetical protein CWC11_22185, partial [Pseudoalteromonas sp. S3178]|uniref:hypothetical protein n=1 Tax=Pseudoalteromonas sp. S3178 TaxID=579532 RepID=UPI00110B259F